MRKKLEQWEPEGSSTNRAGGGRDKSPVHQPIRASLLFYWLIRQQCWSSEGSSDAVESFMRCFTFTKSLSFGFPGTVQVCVHFRAQQHRSKRSGKWKIRRVWRLIVCRLVSLFRYKKRLQMGARIQTQRSRSENRQQVRFFNTGEIFSF